MINGENDKEDPDNCSAHSTWSYPCYSQDKDYGIWLGIDAQHALLKNLDAGIAGWIRTYDNSSRVDQLYIDGGLQYIFNRNICVAGSYKLASKSEDDARFYFRHRVNTDLRASLPYRDLSFSSRLRLQREVKTYIEDEEDHKVNYVARLKFKLDYDIPSRPVTPFLSYELFSPVFKDDGLVINKDRFSGGAEIKMSSRNRVELGYVFQRDYDPFRLNEHFISLSWKVKF
jgi:hypothetical protein